MEMASQDAQFHHQKGVRIDELCPPLPPNTARHRADSVQRGRNPGGILAFLGGVGEIGENDV